MMGWDLCSRGNDCYLHLTMWAWPRLRMALKLLGADVSKMAIYNDGSYVPARVAQSWAKAIEDGIDTLSVARAKSIRTPDEEWYFFVPKDCDKRTAVKLICDYYGGPRGMKQAQIRFDRIDPMSPALRRFLLEFADFCRKSMGFEQW